ncbi:sugar kinase [Diaminobutyricibacter sp. McL0618]|uniref:sugar kinase n=1 Tax=Leifsonia sp. McL0618 TaxID=3415677 RepID=UPI003CF12877
MTSNPAALDIVGFGEVLALLQPPAGTSLATAHHLDLHVAGAEFNACAAAAALGARAAFCTRLGTDPLAEQVVARANELGLELLAEADAYRPTALFLKDVKPDGERRVYYYRSTSAAASMDRIDAERGLERHPRAVLISGLTAALGDGPKRMVERVSELAANRGIAVALDVNLRPQLGRVQESVDSIRTILPTVSILLVGLDDAKLLFDEIEPDRIAEAARATGCSEVVITAGAGGSWWQEEDGTMRHQETLATTIVDPVGAGDAFAGSYLAARLSGLDARAACWLGSAFAAAVIAQTGDTAGLPDSVQARALMDQAESFAEAAS